MSPQAIIAPQDVWGCALCAGMGYQDYPSNQRPCPISGHTKRAEKDMAKARAFLETQRRPYTPEEGNCPYCRANGDPIGIECHHWTGLGWSRDR